MAAVVGLQRSTDAGLAKHGFFRADSRWGRPAAYGICRLRRSFVATHRAFISQFGDGLIDLRKMTAELSGYTSAGLEWPRCTPLES